MSKLKDKINFIKSLFDVTRYEWVIAIREKGEKALFEENAPVPRFTIVKNDKRFWRADPFLFSYNGKEYLFAEMYDRKKNKGVIGVSEIKKGYKTRFKKILELEHHLSYPCVFEANGKIYMLPECYQSDKVTLYEAVKFPYEWKAVDLLEECAVDTTPLFLQDKLYFVTTFVDKIKRVNDNLQLYEFCNGKLQPVGEILRDISSARSAGHWMNDGNQFIRPAQDCSTTYGGGLKFFRCALNPETKEYTQTEIKSFSPTDIDCSFPFAFKGIHTYNANDKYEVIDLKYLGGKSRYAFKENFQNYKRTKKASK